MAIRVGFPVVALEDTAVHPIWLWTDSHNDERGVFWSDDGHLRELDETAPFDSDDPRLNELCGRIARHTRLCFESGSLNHIFKSTGRLRITGHSWGLALGLAERYHLPPPAAAPDHQHVLLTGALDHHWKPTPLRLFEGDRAAAALSAKMRFAWDNNAALVMLQPDYQTLPLRPGGATFEHFRPEARLPNNANHLSATLLEQRHGCPFWFAPANPEAADAAAWFVTLAQSLALEPLLQFRAGPDAVGGAPPDPTAPYRDRLGAIILAALPSRKDCANALLLQHAKTYSLPVLKGGAIEDGLRHSAELFFDPTNDAFAYSNIVIGGPTASGKTFLTEALMLNAVLELQQRVLYVAPIRALTYDRGRELARRLAILEDGGIRSDRIVVSTGERAQSDWRLTRGAFDIALLVNEKANIFLRPGHRLLSDVGLLILDEIHLLSDPQRGGVLDLLLAKCKDENARRTDKAPLRIVAITTERLATDRRVLDTLTVTTAPHAYLPVSVIATTRTPPIQHQACLYRPTSQTWETVPLVAFTTEADRYLSAEARLTLTNRLRAAAEALRRGVTIEAARRDGDVIASLREMILSFRAKGYRSILIAWGNIDSLTSLARSVKKSLAAFVRAGGVPVFTPPEDFKKLLDSGVMGNASRAELLDFASHGIYFHHGELHETLRGWVEEHFRQQVPSDIAAPPLLLFTTETLQYGVNLSADCVILCDHKWVRERLDGANTETVPMAPTEYHNLLGRAGRPGFSHAAPPLGVVCLAEGEDQGYRDFLNLYYSSALPNPQAEPVLSALLLTQDFDRPASTLQDITFGSFRSVLDALRHLGEDRFVSPTEILTFFKKTLFFKTTSRSADDVMALITTILKLSASQGLVLVDAQERYQIGPGAEALIDTGTRWQSVAPMQSWLATLGERFTRRIDDPVELVLPALIGAPDLWVTARTFCWEFGARQGNIEAFAVRENEDHAWTALETELRRIGATSIEELRLALHKFASDEAHLPIPRYGVDAFRPAMLFRLLTAFLMWLRGAEDDDIKTLSLKLPSPDPTSLQGQLKNEAKRFKERYGDRASWLAVMCHRYFGAQARLLPRHSRELPRLAMRLRKGVPTDGLPFLDGDDPPSRTEVAALLAQYNVSPRGVLASPNAAFDIASIPHLPPRLHLRAQALVDGVYKFYREQVLALCAALGQDDTRIHWQAFASLLDRLVSSRHMGCGLPPVENEQLSDLRNIVTGMFDAFGVRWHTMADALRIRIGPGMTADPIEMSFCPPQAVGTLAAGSRPLCLEVFHPWVTSGRLSPGAIGLTACGGMVFAYLLARQFVFADTAAAALANSVGRAMSISEMVGVLSPAQLTGERREAMLGFLEPG